MCVARRYRCAEKAVLEGSSVLFKTARAISVRSLARLVDTGREIIGVQPNEDCYVFVAYSCSSDAN